MLRLLHQGPTRLQRNSIFPELISAWAAWSAINLRLHAKKPQHRLRQVSGFKGVGF
jgi:hypothetical protein